MYFFSLKVLSLKFQKILKIATTTKSNGLTKAEIICKLTIFLKYIFLRNLKFTFLPLNGPYPTNLRNQKSEWQSDDGHVDGCCDHLSEF